MKQTGFFWMEKEWVLFLLIFLVGIVFIVDCLTGVFLPAWLVICVFVILILGFCFFLGWSWSETDFDEEKKE